MSDTKISIIIPNLHSPVVGQVLQALHAQICSDLVLEILVVGLDRQGLVQPDRLVRFIQTEKPVPPPAARNLGAAEARGDTLVFLDADCVPQPAWLEAMLEASSRWPEAGAISGAMLPDGDSFALHCAQIAGFADYLSLSPRGPRPMLATFSLLVRRPVWEASGGFAPELRIAEDVDFSTRLTQAGLRLYLEPRAQVRHRPQRGGWSVLWNHPFVGGSYSITARMRHAAWLKMPSWSVHPWAWRLLSPGIALARTAQIYTSAPGFLRYWYCAPWVALNKLAWCWGAAAGLEHPPILSAHEEHV